jgi:oligopeptidase A
MSNPLLDTSSLPRFADIAPEHVLPALEHLLSAHRSKLDELLNDAADPDFESLVLPLEDMEHELSRVWSPVSHLQGVLGSPEWREVYNAALPILTEYGTELSQNVRLQQAYARVDSRLSGDASEARRSTVALALRDFHLAGVDLPEREKTRFREIMQSLAAIQADFDHNIQDASDAWALPVDDAAELDGLPPQVVQRAAAEASQRGRDGWLLTLDFPTYHAVMTQAENRGLRETFYHGWVTRASDQGANDEWDNSGNIEKILALRHEAAKLVGFDSFSDYSLATKMAKTSGQVVGFLRDLAAHSRPAAEAELAELRDFAGMTVEPWDLTFLLEKLKQHKHSISNEALRQYFPAETVMSGLFELASRLYGVSFDHDPGVVTWHEDARYYHVHNADGDEVGGFYTDLFARTGKRTGAWVDDCVNRKNLDGAMTQPVGFLVCNFSPPDEGGRSLLTHTDVVTVFHEFGHMLHHLLTRIDYPSIAGINGVPWDAVELPSQFMENFAWSYEVLERCSAHADTGEPLPEDLFQRLEESRHTGAALAMMRQIELALFDMRLHAEYDPAAPGAVLSVLDQVRDEVSLVRHPAYNRLPQAFSHIFAGGYAAGYYSYKWAEVLAADAFAAFQENGIFDAGTAARFRREILEIGGSRDFMQAYVDFRGRKPTIDALLRQSGILRT